jgi:UPF0755 protein
MWKSKRFFYFVSILISVILLILVGSYVFLHSSVRMPTVVSLYVYPDDTYEQIINKIQKVGETTKTAYLNWLFNNLGRKKPLPSGHYLIKPGESDWRLARQVLSGRQAPVKITFNNVRTVEQVASRLSDQLLADSLSLVSCFKDTAWYREEGFTQDTYSCIFIPNTYEVWWNAKPERIRARLLSEYRKFWNEARVYAAKRHKLTPIEAQILASIVEEETNKGDEMSKVAGLYLNRLKLDMPLQADPTVKYAAGDVTMKRIYKNHTKIQSPYNTYINSGLPPGPIRVTSIRAIEAVLNAKRHAYLYMCAKPDFSGYHAFATTLKQHNKNAAAYHEALNNRGILE